MPKTLNKIRVALRAAPGAINRNNNTIEGVAVVTRGEALGHSLWLDSEFIDAVAAAGNAKPNGIKARFTHPGLCADGMGSFLGRLKNFRRDKDMVRADLSLSKSAFHSPKGNLGAYVMGLAQDDPESFGMSIVFSRNEQAEADFVKMNLKEDVFCSPDEDNDENMYHARLETLFASDVVDEPAANPGGFFSAADELPEIGDTALGYVFGKIADIPPETFGNIEPRKVREFVSDWLARNKMAVVPADAGQPMAATDTKTMTAVDDAVVIVHEREPVMAEQKQEVKPEVPAVDVEALKSAAKADGAKQAREELGTLLAAFPDHTAFAIEQWGKGNGLDSAKLAFKDIEIAELKAKLAAAPKVEAPKTGTDPVTFAPAVSAPKPAGPESLRAAAKELREKNKGMGVAESFEAAAKLYPELYEKEKRA